MDAGVSGERERILRLLERHGYRSWFRQETWHECRLAGPTEAWVGHGESAEQAFEHALAQAFPTRLARLALAELTEPALEPAPQSAPHPAAPPERPATAAAPLPQDSPDRVQHPPLAYAPALEAQPSAAPRATPAPHAPARDLPGRPRLSRERALDEVERILDSLQREASEVALWSPVRQRLALLIWIARARELQNACDERAVKERVHEVARALGHWSARWWPGSVTALQEATYPAACTGELGLESPPETWTEVARAAEERLAALEVEDEAAGADEDGWWDAPALEPAHPDPTGALREAVRKLGEAAGPLDAKPPKMLAPTLAPGEPLRLAKTLRWLRGSGSDGVAIGDALGRLRWIAWKLRDGELEAWLDPRRRPQRSWAHEHGYDPEKSTRRERRRAVLRALPAPDSGPDGARVSAWLREAFECSDLELARMASLVQPFAAVVLGLAATKDFSAERKHRTKLARLQDLLREPSALPERAGLLAEELAGEDDELAVPLVARPDPAAELLAEVLPWTRGRNALLVTNRGDPELDETLRTTLELATLDHEIANPRRIDALEERILSGRYDLVLSATGFQSHSTSERLESAARRAGIACSRIHRARRLACIRALHRDRPGALRAR